MPKTSLRAHSARTIVAAIADAAARWCDADFPPRVRATAAIEARLGYTTPVVEYALDGLFFSLRRESLIAAIADELGSLDALDGFVARDGRPPAFARGVPRVVIISSDTTIGVALPAALFALCAKCDVVVKDRSDALVAAFFATLAEELPEFAAAACAHTWRGGEDAQETALLAAADVVIAFGRDEALRAMRAHCAPDARFIAFGHRVSIGYLTHTGLAGRERARLLDGIAADTLLYDGEGCLSLHALFVERDGDLDVLTRDLTHAFERVTVEFPAGRLDPARATSVAAYRNLGAFRAATGSTPSLLSLGSATLALNPPRDAPLPLLPRVLPIYVVDESEEILAFARAQHLPIQALGVADPSDPHVRALAEHLGAVRIARFGTMQAPPLAGRHGGAARISDVVRWIDAQ
jgi:hypothetical protein